MVRPTRSLVVTEMRISSAPAGGARCSKKSLDEHFVGIFRIASCEARSRWLTLEPRRRFAGRHRRSQRMGRRVAAGLIGRASRQRNCRKIGLHPTFQATSSGQTRLSAALLCRIKKCSSWNRVGDFGLVSRLCLLRSNPSVRSAPSFRPDLHARYADARSGGQGWPAFGPPLQRREASLTAASTTA